MRSAALVAMNIPLLRIMGWSLLHFLWQGSILAMALSGFLSVAWKLSPRIRYLAACGVFASMLLCPVVTFAYLCANVSSSSSASSSSQRIQATQLFSQSAWDHVSSPLFERSVAVADHEMTWIMAFWCAGVVILLTRLAAGTIVVARLKRSSLIPVPLELRSIADRLSSQLKLPHKCRLFASPAIAGPVAVGWTKPLILLPLHSLSSLSAEQVEALLAHELAHVSRHDYLVNTLQAVAESLFFYHPAVWWVSKQMRQEREHCCDDIAVKASGSPIYFARALSLLEEQRASASTQLILSAHGGHMAMRIKRLLGQSKPTITLRGTVFWILSSGVVAVVSFFSFCSLAAGDVGAFSQSQSTPPAASGTANKRPDMSCTYYDTQTPVLQALPGTCGTQEDSYRYYCTENGGQHRIEKQKACKWKVERLEQWKAAQHISE